MDKTLLEKYNGLLAPGKSVSFSEAEHRAGEFLYAMALVTDWKHALSEQKIKALSIQTAVYAEQLSKGTAKTVTENKTAAEASPEYCAAREELERIENDISYLRAFFDIYSNSHVFYRQMAKGEGM